MFFLKNHEISTVVVYLIIGLEIKIKTLLQRIFHKISHAHIKSMI